MRRLLAGVTVAAVAICNPMALAQDAAPAAGDTQSAAAAGAPAAPLSQETLDLAMQVVKLSGTSRTFDELLPNIADEAKQQFVRANPQMQLGIIAVVDRVARDLVARRPELDTYLAQIWGAAFTNEELQAYIDFYSSDAGRKLATLQNKLVSVEMAAAQKWSRDIGQALTEKVTAELRATMAAEGNSLGGTPAPAAPAQ